MITHTKEFGIYHWDIFEDPGYDTFLVAEADTLAEAELLVKKKYRDRMSFDGADAVEIVDKEGNIRKSWKVG
jgi:hypothetical protein